MRLSFPVTMLVAMSLDPSGDHSVPRLPCSNCCRPGRPGSSSHAVALNPTSRRVSSGASLSVWTTVGGPAVPISFPSRSKIVTCDRPAVPGRQATTPVRETEKCAA